MLSEALVDAVAGRSPRLMVLMPPRHGKSQLVSHWFPVWFLNRWPDRRVILSSYEADFAASWGRQVRNTIVDHESELKVRIADDSSAANRWDTTVGGGMVTAGVGGPITGRGANCLLVDDPVKNQEEASSPTYRQKTWDWWTSVAYTRLEPGGVAIVVMTRWHEDDLGGRLLKNMEMGGEHWRVLCLPAISRESDPLGRQPGEALWPERYNTEALANIKRAVGSRVWASLYDQSPIADGGLLFKRQWFEIVDAVPADAERARYWDLAATEAKPGRDPDWTAGCKMAEKDGIYYIEDIQHARERPLGIENLTKQTAELDGIGVAIYIEQEPGSSGVNTIDHYTRQVLKGFTVRGERADTSKTERANPLSAAAEAGNVKLKRAPWNDEFLTELCAFPNGAHDDLVDSASGAMRKLNAPGVWMQ